MRRRRATHMAAVEEEVERLSQENSLLLHRLSQLVASHQVVDGENQQLRAELLALRQSVVRSPLQRSAQRRPPCVADAPSVTCITALTE
jgi:hypothetical protein